MACISRTDLLSPTDLLKISCRLGVPANFALGKYTPAGFPPEVTMIDSHGDGLTAAPRGFGEGWHQDSTYLKHPPAFTVLHAYEVPESGGNTLFADTRTVVEEMSPQRVNVFRQMSLEHSLRHTYRVATRDCGKTLADISRDLPSQRHALVFDHPRGGATLRLSPLYTLPYLTPETQSLVQELTEEVTAHPLVHEWTVGDILIWDNRVVLHSATPFPETSRRRLIRVTVQDPADAAV